MGFLKKMGQMWKEMKTADKINMAIDIVCGAGAAIISKKAGDKLCEDSESKVERALIRITTAGAVAAGAEAGANFLKRNYGDTSGLLIDVARGKAKLDEVRPTKDGIEFVSVEEARHE